MFPCDARRGRRRAGCIGPTTDFRRTILRVDPQGAPAIFRRLRDAGLPGRASEGPCGGIGRRARTQNRVPQGVLVRFRPGAPYSKSISNRAPVTTRDGRRATRNDMAPHSRDTMRPPAMMLIDVARMSEATSGKDCPAYRCAHAGYVAAQRSYHRCVRQRRRSPPMMLNGVARMSEAISGKTAPHVAALMRATVAPGSSRAPANGAPMMNGVARMSETISGKGCPAYRCAHAGYGCAVVAGAREEALRVDRCSPDERSEPGRTAPHIARSCGLRSLRRRVASALREAPRVDRCSPDERSISGKNPRISLRSCGLRLQAVARCGRRERPSVLPGVARMSEAISGEDCPAYRFAHAGYGCAGDVAGACGEALRVDRCSPDERSDIREGLPRISLRSCGLRLLSVIGFGARSRRRLRASPHRQDRQSFNAGPLSRQTPCPAKSFPPCSSRQA